MVFALVQETGQGQMQVAVLKDVIEGKSDLLGRLPIPLLRAAVNMQCLFLCIFPDLGVCCSCCSAALKDPDMKCVFPGALVMEVTRDAVDAALHKQGTYALQKVLESPCRDSEFVSLGSSLMDKALLLVNGEPGIYVMAKLVDQLVGV